MPKITMSERSRTITMKALGRYQSELNMILEAVRTETRLAQKPEDAYLPKDILADHHSADRCSRVLSMTKDSHLRLFGVEFYDEDMRVMHSARLLYKDELVERAMALKADPLSPPGASAVLQDHIEELDAQSDHFWGKYGEAPSLVELRRRRSIRLGLAYPDDVPLDVALQGLEGQSIEFMEKYPDNARELAREIAAFATISPGSIFLGINDAGVPVGLKDIDTPEARDKLCLRIEGVCANNVSPSIICPVRFEEYGGVTIARIQVPKGPSPVYYAGDTPYIRHGSMSRPARHQEVVELVRSFLDRQKA